MTASGNWELKEERLVICEGDHSKFFLESLIRGHGLDSFQVGHAYECNGMRRPGQSGFGLAIEGLPAFEGFDKLRGIAIVTDNDNEQTLSRVEKDLRKHGYTPTESKCVGRLRDTPVVIILIPGPNQHGNLETLCLPVLHDVWPTAKDCVEAYLDCTGATAWKKHKELDKARVRSIIAGYFEEDPYKGLGHLFQNRTLSATHQHFDRLADIFRRFDDIVKNGTF